jgi:FtsH-binding integral membrane protein
VAPLNDFLASRAAGVATAPSGEEDLRFIRNFHDVFLAIGILLLAIGLAVGVSVYVTTSGMEDPQSGAITTGALFAGCAAIMWGLGEVFARRRRLFLPAIAIVCALTVFTVISVALLYAGVLAGRGFEGLDISTMPPELRYGILLATAFAFIAPFAFYLRFRLPFSLGLTGGGVAAFVIIAALISNFELAMRFISPLYLVLGIVLFLAGVAFDARDPARTTRYSDNGFWLHFAAAPLILNGAFGLIGQLFGAPEGLPSTGALVSSAAEGSATATAHAALTLAVVVLLGVISLLINRRVLIVSTLITTGVAIGILMNAVGLGAGALAATTLIVLGAFVLILGASWHSTRRALLGWVKPDGAWARIFPPEAPAAS